MNPDKPISYNFFPVCPTSGRRELNSHQLIKFKTAVIWRSCSKSKSVASFKSPKYLCFVEVFMMVLLKGRDYVSMKGQIINDMEPSSGQGCRRSSWTNWRNGGWLLVIIAQRNEQRMDNYGQYTVHPVLVSHDLACHSPSRTFQIFSENCSNTN